MALTKGAPAKEGSLQQFVASECSAEDMGHLKFALSDVHKIGILDIRLFNTDRHAGNILLHASTDGGCMQMTPIDHGLCLPSYKHLDGACFDWLQWPQAQFPFTSEALDHIASLDMEKDAALLRSVGMDEETVTTMRLCTSLLQTGAALGYSLFEIGSCLQRDGDFSHPSVLEHAVAKAALRVNETTGLLEREHGTQFMGALVKEVASVAESLLEDQPRKKVRSFSCL